MNRDRQEELERLEKELLADTAEEAPEEEAVFEEEDFLKTGKYLNEGNIGFCYRSGNHYFSRDDWHGLFDFMNK